MNRKALTCLGIVIALLLGLFGQQALALCVSSDHLAIEVMGHPPCGPTSWSDGQKTISGAPCNDILIGGLNETSLQAKRDATQLALMPSGSAALPPTGTAPTPERRGTPWRTVTIERDPHLHSLRTVILLI